MVLVLISKRLRPALSCDDWGAQTPTARDGPDVARANGIGLYAPAYPVRRHRQGRPVHCAPGTMIVWRA